MPIQNRQPTVNIEYEQQVRSQLSGAQPLDLVIAPLQTQHILEVAQLQRLSYPSLTEQELIDESRYRKFLHVFPEGQLIALAQVNGGFVPVGSTTTFRTHFDFRHQQHAFLDTVNAGLQGQQSSNGDWLYGVDLNIHPAYRGMGIGSRLYAARHALARRLNLRGEIAGGMIPGYADHEDWLSVAQYVLRVHQSRLYDPTLSMQLRNGFQIRGILYNYLSDQRSHHAAALIVRANPDFRSSSPSRR